MPEFVLPAEADHCPHCGKVLRMPPACCDAMVNEYLAEEIDISDDLFFDVTYYSMDGGTESHDVGM